MIAVVTGGLVEDHKLCGREVLKRKVLVYAIMPYVLLPRITERMQRNIDVAQGWSLATVLYVAMRSAR